MRTKLVSVYSFDDLDDSAKEAARDWWRTGYDSFHADFVLEDAVKCGEILGIEFAQRAVPLMNGSQRYEPIVCYSGFSSQGDGACFEGRYTYAKGAAKAIRKHAPDDAILHDLADRLQAAQRPHFYRLGADCKQSGHHYHSGCMAVDVWDGQGSLAYDTPADEEVRQVLREFADWIYRQLEQEYDYQMSDEQIDDTIRANEYEFDETGALA